MTESGRESAAVTNMLSGEKNYHGGPALGTIATVLHLVKSLTVNLDMPYILQIT